VVAGGLGGLGSTLSFSSSSFSSLLLFGLELSSAKICEPQTRARLGTTAHLCKAVALTVVLGLVLLVGGEERLHVDRDQVPPRQGHLSGCGVGGKAPIYIY